MKGINNLDAVRELVVLHRGDLLEAERAHVDERREHERVEHAEGARERHAAHHAVGARQEAALQPLRRKRSSRELPR